MIYITLPELHLYPIWVYNGGIESKGDQLPATDHKEIDMTTQTGIPIRHCETCGYRHPITRKRCTICGKSALFCHPGAERK